MSSVDARFFKVSTPSEGVALVSISRPPVNAFNGQLWREIPLVFNRLSQDPSVRVVILASSQRIFSAGLDLTYAGDLLETKDKDPARNALTFRTLLVEFQEAISSIEKCRVPVIAAVHGIAYGLGVDILSTCDIRYATSDTIFSIKEVDIGMAADVGSLARFPKVVGNDSFTREVALTGRDFSAAEALRAGFISRIVEGGKDAVLASALETAKLIASKSPVAVIGTKHLLLHSRDHGVQENLDYTVAWNQAMLQSEDIGEAVKSFIEKRRPNFRSIGPKL